MRWTEKRHYTFRLKKKTILLKPIDEYVGKIQEQIDALRVEGSDKVNSLKKSDCNSKRE
mgnify:CR=1 FL=1